MLLSTTATSCIFDPPPPPCELDQGPITIVLHPQPLDFLAVWGLDSASLSHWWYGWDTDDERLWGPIGYASPEAYDLSLVFDGVDAPTSGYLSAQESTIYTDSLHTTLDMGYYDILSWSLPALASEAQALTIDDHTPLAPTATASSSQDVSNAPEPFYSGTLADAKLTTTYLNELYLNDSLLPDKTIHLTLYPRVYIYLVQLLVYNNSGRLSSIPADASVSHLAESVDLADGHTSSATTTVLLPMRIKRSVATGRSRKADVVGGRLTTFGLPSAQAWETSTTTHYTDLRQLLQIRVGFSNSRDSTLTFDVSSQLQRQAHGGIITLEIDMDTVHLPQATGQGGSSFNPWVDEFADSITYVIPL